MYEELLVQFGKLYDAARYNAAYVVWCMIPKDVKYAQLRMGQNFDMLTVKRISFAGEV